MNEIWKNWLLSALNAEKPIRNNNQPSSLIGPVRSMYWHLSGKVVFALADCLDIQRLILAAVGRTE